MKKKRTHLQPTMSGVLNFLKNLLNHERVHAPVLDFPLLIVPDNAGKVAK